VSIVVVESPTLGEGWLRTSRAILERGALERYVDQPTRELALLTLIVEQPSSDDPLIAELGDAEWLAWMHENFFVQNDVPATRRATPCGCSITQAPVAIRSRGWSSACAPTRIVIPQPLQEHVAGELDCAIGRLVVHAKSAHVYEPEWTLMARLAGVAERVG
jgi:hypothetical protein